MTKNGTLGTNKISPSFGLIKAYATKDEPVVTPRVTDWNQIFSAFSLLYSSLIKPQEAYSTYSL